MKKNEFPNKDFTIQFKDFSKFLALFKRVYDEQRHPKKIAEFERELEKHEGIENKIKFCKNFKEYYHNTLPCEISIVSGRSFIFDMYPKGTALFFDGIIDEKIILLEATLKTQKNIGKRKEYSLKEVALAYIFETYATSETIPKSPQGDYSKNKLEYVGEHEYNVKGNSFYCEVRKILNYELDLNTEFHLKQISPRWFDVVKEICIKRKSWDAVEKYLKQKKLLKR